MFNKLRHWIAGALIGALLLTPAYAATTSTVIGGLTKQFQASGSDTVPAWANSINLTLQGAGGGGAASASGGGGASGMSWYIRNVPVTPGATLTITVGALGTSGVAGGSTTVTGALVTLPTACGGAAGAAGAGGVGGAGTGCPAGNVNNSHYTTAAQTSSTGSQVPPSLAIGQDGSNPGLNISTCIYDWSVITGAGGGSGGCSKFGKGGAGPAAGAGVNATGFGAGGSGAGTGSSVGGNGSGGLVIIQYQP